VMDRFSLDKWMKEGSVVKARHCLSPDHMREMEYLYEIITNI
jgi:hypothetical protein